MSERYDCTDAAQRATGLAEAATSLRKGDLAVMPTDTVYGLAADAFSPPAVASLLAAKGRGRQMPPPVLVGTVRAATALVEGLNESGKDLIDEFWPGGLTLILRANRNLIWDLGDTKGTVAVRMPLHEIALELLKETGPLAVSSANRSGAPPATTAADGGGPAGRRGRGLSGRRALPRRRPVHDRGPDRRRPPAAAGGGDLDCAPPAGRHPGRRR